MDGQVFMQFCPVLKWQFYYFETGHLFILKNCLRRNIPFYNTTEERDTSSEALKKTVFISIKKRITINVFFFS